MLPLTARPLRYFVSQLVSLPPIGDGVDQMARHETSGNSGIRTQQVCNGIAKVTNFIPRVAQSLDTLGSVASFRSWCKRNRLGTSYSTRERLWQTQIVPRLNAASSNDSTLHVFEFGVAFGEASRWWLEQLTSTAADYHGFNRFTGLPTDWRGCPRVHSTPAATLLPSTIRE